MSKKPSFLERLTGVLEEEENSSAVHISGKEINDEEKNMESNRAKKTAMKKPIAPEERPAIQEKISDDWMPESEGQLTIDVYQTPSDVVIKSTIAGVKPEDLDITITNDMVTIKGKREKDEVISDGDYYYQECYWGSFSRSVILPVDVESEKVEASMKNGILSIRLPKIEKVKTRKIKVLS